MATSRAGRSPQTQSRMPSLGCTSPSCAVDGSQRASAPLQIRAGNAHTPTDPASTPHLIRRVEGGGHARQATSRPRPPPPSISSLNHETPSKVLIARFLPIIRVVIIFIMIILSLFFTSTITTPAPGPSPPSPHTSPSISLNRPPLQVCARTHRAPQARASRTGRRRNRRSARRRGRA